MACTRRESWQVFRMRGSKDREPRTMRVQYCGNPNGENFKKRAKVKLPAEEESRSEEVDKILHLI